MKYIVIVFICLLFMSCNSRKKENANNEKVISMNQPSKSVESLKIAVLKTGDIHAYDELSIAYLDNPFQEEFLLYSLIMANKYDYPQAYFDVFYCLSDVYRSDISSLDEQSAILAITYLLKASEKGHQQAIEMVEDFEIKSSENSKMQIERIFKE